MPGVILPGRTIGIIGGGQLGRMIALSARAMGYRVAVLDPTPGCPCGQVADWEITAPYGDLAAVKKLAAVSDVITYEFESIDCDALSYLEQYAYLPQGSKLLQITRDRRLEKQAVSDLGLPVTPFHSVKSATELRRSVFMPSVLKTATGGYDGKGQVPIRGEADLDAAEALICKGACILEKWVPFEKEISVIVVGSATGETSVFPVAENIHRDGILHQTIVPARISRRVAQAATLCGLKIAEGLGLVGTLAIEMFVTAGGGIFVNELAPRPHNSGHYSIDACETSQFEQHIRSMCGLPLGRTALYAPAVMVNILGEHLGRLSAYLPLLPEGKLHLYGKAESRPKRKMGHITLLSDDLEKTLQKIHRTKIWAET